jgi:hypothetical protein
VHAANLNGAEAGKINQRPNNEDNVQAPVSPKAGEEKLAPAAIFWFAFGHRATLNGECFAINVNVIPSRNVEATPASRRVLARRRAGSSAPALTETVIKITVAG